MNDVLTWDEIVERYPDEWVLIDEPEFDGDLQGLQGRVVYHGVDVVTLERVALELRLQSDALLFTGKLTEPGVAYMLAAVQLRRSSRAATAPTV